ncbi:NAD(P)/FAD-dependent oxidoreductase [candidate division KSB1 bacterium]|nr:NAD(P)/FAD-dependent oxidoreductase [candidate division KSB1 bacterium]
MTPENRFHVIVIGGGPAGLIAAAQAAQHGASTLLLERMRTPARKLMITGKGRCNITNLAPLPEFISHIQPDGRFLRQAFSRFFHDELIELLSSLGVKVKVERGERVFPASDSAKDVVDAFIYYAKQTGVKIIPRAQVENIEKRSDKLWQIDADIHTSDDVETQRQFLASCVVIATGGKAYPATGSKGDGYEWARRLGHTITEPTPALVPLITAGTTAKQLQGLSLRNVSVSVWIDQKKRGECFGEMLFTETELSGPIILTLSRNIVLALHERHSVTISIDLKPALDEQQLDNRLLRDIDQYGKRTVKSFLKGLLPKSLIPVCLQQVELNAENLCHQITSNQRKKLRYWLKNFRFEIIGHGDFRDAIITAGGVNIKEIFPGTMESRLHAGLFFAGEILDVDADTGGFNLQIAFSTGWVAGISAAERSGIVNNKL